MVDAAIGGKTGVNHPKAKPDWGIPSAATLIDPQVLNTLPVEFRAGMAEVIKYGVIWDADLFAQMNSVIAWINYATWKANCKKSSPFLPSQS